MLNSSVQKSNNYSETMGTIVGLRSCGSGGNSGGSTFGAIIEYTVENKLYTFEPNGCTNPPPTVGKEIRVLYNPDDPQDGASGTWVGLYLFPTILFSIGISTLLVLLCCACRCLSMASEIKDEPMKPSSLPLANSNFTTTPNSNTAPYGQSPTAPNIVAQPQQSSLTPAPIDQPYASTYSNNNQSPYLQTQQEPSGPESIFDQLQNNNRK